MKVAFVGPTVPDAVRLAGNTLTIRPPARQGDVLRAVRDGAAAIGLIDGNFEYVAPVWHKEILFALSEGVAVFGAASMGALRAAECADFGMAGIGEIFRQYVSGEAEDDSDVALLHAPEELGYAPLTIPLVNVRATLRRLLELRSFSVEDAACVEEAVSSLFYKERTWGAIAARARLMTSGDALIGKLRAGYVDQKRADGLELLEALRSHPGERQHVKCQWTFHATSLWKRALDPLPYSTGEPA
ncbi:antibiotic resistance protein [Sinorhizobium meliloti]|uniref:TfuA-like protein n=1 Tax=Rhizobium meliloti TaxID=382 RepID=UPI000FDBD23F|nr:TfuA-like protein [Sinorhizobium meliloti]MDW9778139.1 antibiotic resistance protein [Sinorhizobium meliloti]RVK74900.1 antibiotic resistance protein [Sinorhizobium meliloti]RVL10606.1 antibiotic resistance protein [Sinorhizobium meliloti]RVQ71338.1 antibiotic resistance protein [Sinorhizobium meliloti]